MLSADALPGSPLLVLLEPLLPLQPEPLPLPLLVPLLPGPEHGVGRRLLRAVMFVISHGRYNPMFHSQVLLHSLAYLSDLSLAFCLLPGFLGVLVIRVGEYIHLHIYE